MQDISCLYEGSNFNPVTVIKTEKMSTPFSCQQGKTNPASKNT